MWSKINYIAEVYENVKEAVQLLRASETSADGTISLERALSLLRQLRDRNFYDQELLSVLRLLEQDINGLALKQALGPPAALELRGWLYNFRLFVNGQEAKLIGQRLMQKSVLI